MNNYLVCSQNNEMAKILIDEILKDLSGYDLIKYNEDESISLAIDDLDTISMFGNKKVIIKKTNFSFTKEEEKSLEKYLENSNDNYLILLFIGNIDKRKKIVKYFIKQDKYYSDDAFDYEKYINQYLKNNNFKINDAKYFLNIVGSNINNIINELDKLIIYKDDDKIITNDDIDLIAISNFEDNIFAFTDAIIKEQKSLSMKLYEQFLLQGYDEIALIGIIANQFRSMFQVKKLYSDGKSFEDISRILKFSNPYRAKAIYKNSYNYSENDLLLYLKKLGDIDYKIKSGKGNKKHLFELFLINKNI